MASLQHAAFVSLQIQDAVNLSAVVLEFNEVLRETLWPEAHRRGLGTRWVNQHPIATLFLSKIADLNGVPCIDSNRLELALREVKAIAEGAI